MQRFRRRLYGGLIILITGFWTVAGITYSQLHPPPDDLHSLQSHQNVPTYQDRHNIALTYRYQGRWNSHYLLDRDQIPLQFENLLLLSEDQRFYDHKGIDWQARLKAVWINLQHMSVLRGASTISEQVVRLIHLRPRTLWSRWLEGWEAYWLEQKQSKAQILTFYINQVPFSRQRRGLWQAARLYFNQHPQNLTLSEMLALIVMIRAPSAYDPLKPVQKFGQKYQWALQQLADRAESAGLITPRQRVLTATYAPRYQGQAPLYVSAPQFISYLEKNKRLPNHTRRQKVIQTTLDASLQKQIDKLTKHHLQRLRPYQVGHGAVIVTDHQQQQILAWISATAEKPTAAHSPLGYDMALLRRQPGSTLKPFVYAMALEKGWHIYQLINDAPLIEAVGGGLHAYQNYSRRFYGRVSLKDALGNSLNIPALKALQYVGQVPFLQKLRQLGLVSLTQTAQYYGDGLVIGNGAVSLWQLVQAYSVLAQRGLKTDYRFYMDQPLEKQNRSNRLFSVETADLLSHILSDPKARTLEFGQDSVLSFPVQTAVKTGTSSGHRDVWLMAYNDRYVVGIWMGNLDQTPMLGVTGASGPAPLARQIFQLLNKNRKTTTLPISAHLWQGQYCFRTDQTQPCQMRIGYFHRPVSDLPQDPLLHQNQSDVLAVPILKRPTHNLRLALSPRLSKADQAFQFYISDIKANQQILWKVKQVGTGRIQYHYKRGGELTWPLQKGTFWVEAKHIQQKQNTTFGPVRLFVR